MSRTQTVREIALEQPAAIRVFEQFGIDYCCGGRKPLTEACAAANLQIDLVLSAIATATRHAAPDTKDWTHASLESLIRHIVATHHAYVLRELPRLATLAQKVVNRHGDTQAHLPMIQIKIAQLAAELTQHLAKEESILFPYIIEVERSLVEGVPAPPSCFGTITNPIALMTAEHDAAGTLLADIRSLSRNFTPPIGACPTYVGFYVALKEFEQDLHQHIHLENNILFPRAIALDPQAAATQLSAIESSVARGN
jgi:regulator of cell morphogenesis and NO signaling